MVRDPIFFKFFFLGLHLQWRNKRKKIQTNENYFCLSACLLVGLVCMEKVELQSYLIYSISGIHQKNRRKKPKSYCSISCAKIIIIFFCWLLSTCLKLDFIINIIIFAWFRNFRIKKKVQDLLEIEIFACLCTKKSQRISMKIKM